MPRSKRKSAAPEPKNNVVNFPGHDRERSDANPVPPIAWNRRGLAGDLQIPIPVPACVPEDGFTAVMVRDDSLKPFGIARGSLLTILGFDVDQEPVKGDELILFRVKATDELAVRKIELVGDNVHLATPWDDRRAFHKDEIEVIGAVIAATIRKVDWPDIDATTARGNEPSANMTHDADEWPEVLI